MAKLLFLSVSFLHFITSLIKFILWLKFFTDKRQTEDYVGGVGVVHSGKFYRVLLSLCLHEIYNSGSSGNCYGEVLEQIATN